jgi:hypothetical protein
MVARARKDGRAARGAAQRPPSEAALRLFDVLKYGGQWVATRHDEVLVAGPSFGAVDREVRRLGLQGEVILARVPRKGELAR